MTTLLFLLALSAGPPVDTDLPAPRAVLAAACSGTTCPVPATRTSADPLPTLDQAIAKLAEDGKTWAATAGSLATAQVALLQAQTVVSTLCVAVSASQAAMDADQATIAKILHPPAPVPVHTLTSITVSPAAVSVAAGSITRFAAVGLDESGNPMATQPAVTWSTTVGTIEAGYLTAPASGSGTVTATSGAMSGSASVTVGTTPPPPGPPTPNPSGHTLTLLEIGQTTCAPCNAADAILAGLPGIVRQRINTDTDPTAVKTWKPMYYPTFVMLVNGQEIVRYPNAANDPPLKWDAAQFTDWWNRMEAWIPLKWPPAAPADWRRN